MLILRRTINGVVIEFLQKEKRFEVVVKGKKNNMKMFSTASIKKAHKWMMKEYLKIKKGGLNVTSNSK